MTGSPARIGYYSSGIREIYPRNFVTAKRKTPTNRKSVPESIATIHGTRRNTQSYVRGTNSLLINQYKAAGTKNAKAVAIEFAADNRPESAAEAMMTTNDPSKRRSKLDNASQWYRVLSMVRGYSETV
jgi:hypothetical protein